jgi:hypothetical protein
MRFNLCCENKLIPFISLINNDKTIIIFSDIMRELHNPNSRIDTSEVASLQELANTIGLQYSQKWLNGKNTRVAYGEVTTFISFLDSEIKESSEELEPELTSLEQSKSEKSNIN